MEQKIDMKQDRENQKFWDNWLNQEQSLVVGNAPVIDKEEKEQVAEKLGLHKRSITPTTLDQVVFDKNPYEDLLYKEVYRYKDNAVTRFAFDEKLLPYEKFSDSKQVGSWKSSKKSDAIKKNADFIELHELENHLLKQSISYLLDEKQKTVVVDIFARDKGQIKNDEGFVELHSVVLVSQNKKIYVIDPSNFSFSCHLSNFNQALVITKYSMDKIYEPPSSIKSDIGKELTAKYKSVTGSRSEQYRDCIDIAVKLALGINIKKSIDLDKIVDMDVVQEITNNPEVNLNLPFDQNTVSKIRQASNESVRKYANSLYANIDKKIKSSHALNTELEQKLIEHSFNIFNKNYDYENYKVAIKDLLSLDKTVSSELISHINSTTYDILSGAIEENLDY